MEQEDRGRKPENDLRRRAMFLTPHELADFTGLRQKAAQCRWLTRNGIPFRKRADGRAVVSRDHVRRLMATDIPSEDLITTASVTAVPQG